MSKKNEKENNSTPESNNPWEKNGDDRSGKGGRPRDSLSRTFFLAIALTCATLAVIAWLNNPKAPVGATPDSGATTSLTIVTGKPNLQTTATSTATAATSTAASTTTGKKTEAVTTKATASRVTTTKATTKATTAKVTTTKATVPIS